MLRVGIVGATGYVGLELVRLLSMHTGVKIAHLVSLSYQGQRIGDIYPSLRGCAEHVLQGADYSMLAKECDIVFTALPHGASAPAVAQLYESGIKVIDLSADYRYKNADVYAKWYGLEHQRADLLAQSVYGLPEIYRRQMQQSRLIASPSCYTTCAILALAPLLRAGLISDKHIIIDAKSGVSGAGAKPSATVHFCEVEGSLKAYSVTNHRHTSEIEQELSIAAGSEVIVSFTPHLLPIKRGILSTIYAELSDGQNIAAVRTAYENAYGDEPFVSLYEAGSLPEIKHVVGSNKCAIGYVVDPRLGRLVIVSCLDNLIKGAAGQAVQAMNIIAGYDEASGLSMPALYL